MLSILTAAACLILREININVTKINLYPAESVIGN